MNREIKRMIQAAKLYQWQVAKALGMKGVVPECAEVANAVGAAASHVSVEQEVRVNPVRGSDGVVKGYQVASIEAARMYDNQMEALEAARAQARELAMAEARQRGASGELKCALEEGRHVYSSTGNMEIVRGWTVRATVE